MKYRLTGALTCVLLAGACAASAKIIEVTETGIVQQGLDVSGLFGASGTDLTGQSYAASILIDTSKGYYQGGVIFGPGPQGSSPVPYERTSGIFNDEIQSSVAIIGSISIDNRTKTIDGTVSGENLWELTSYHIGFNSLYTNVASADASLSFFSYPYFVGATDAFNSATDPNLSPVSQQDNYSSVVGYQSLESTFAAADTKLQLYATSYSYLVLDAAGGPMSAAPEPSTWTLLIAGVGLMGAALRFGRLQKQVCA